MKRIAISKRTRFLVLQRDDFTCQYCGAKAPDAELQIDHIHPVVAGGRVDLANLAVACVDCNSGKKAELLKSIPRAGAWADTVEDIPTPGMFELEEIGFLPVPKERIPIPDAIPVFQDCLTRSQLYVCDMVAEAHIRALKDYCPDWEYSGLQDEGIGDMFPSSKCLLFAPPGIESLEDEEAYLKEFEDDFWGDPGEPAWPT